MRALVVCLVLAACSPPEPAVRIDDGQIHQIEPIDLVCSRAGEVGAFYTNAVGETYGPILTGERCDYQTYLARTGQR